MLASAAIICGASAAIGAALLVACGWRRWPWLSGAVGLAAILCAAGLASRLPGRSLTAAVLLAVLTAISLAYLARAQIPAAPLRLGAATALLAGLLTSIPFLVNGRVGILGAGLVNDDMASHLVMADWVQSRTGEEPGLIADGYPLGPHALVAALADALGVGHIEAFAGLTLAIGVIAAWTALDGLQELSPVRRVLGTMLVALPYLGAAYLAQGAFKEPLLAVLLIAFALMLDARDGGVGKAVPLGVLVAGAVYLYSFPALFWFAGTAALWGLIRVLHSGGTVAERIRYALPRLAGAIGLAGAVVLLATLPELERILRFAGFQAFDPGTDGFGNLAHPLSPLEALGVWPTSDFRVSATDASLPAPFFYVGAVLAMVVLAIGIRRAWTKRSSGVLAALGCAVAIYAGSAATVTAYASAKALAVAAPLVVLVAVSGLAGTGRDGGRRGLVTAGLATLFVGAALISTLMVLRQAPVGPMDHMDELAEIRPLVEGEKVLFLGRDNFVLYELRGSRPFTHVRNYYDPYFARPNFKLRDVGAKFDFDAVTSKTLAGFPYVITTRAAYASGPPPSYEATRVTDSYVLWRAEGSRSALRRLPVERGAEPTGRLPCALVQARPGGVAAVTEGRAVRANAWTAATIEGGEEAALDLDLEAGRWLLSLQYDATRPLTLAGPSLDAELPPNLDYRGVAPFWPAGEITVDGGGPVRLSASVESPPLVGRLVGASSVAHLGAVAATPAGRGYATGVEPPYPGAGERIATGPSCGAEADWVIPPP